MLPRRLCDPAAAHHSSEFLDSGLAFQRFYSSDGTSVRHLLFNSILMIREGGDLCQVSNAQDLVSRRQFLDLLAYSFRCLPSDSRIDFIEYEGLMRPIYREDGSQGQHDS